MSFEHCDDPACAACMICSVLDDMKDQLPLEAAINLALNCVGEVYDIAITSGHIAEGPSFDEVVH